MTIMFLLWSKKQSKRVLRQQQNEKSLQNRLEFIQTILDSLPNMVALRNKDHQMILCNRAYKETLTVDFWLGLDNRFKEQYYTEQLEIWEHGREVTGLHIYIDERDHGKKYASYSHRLCLDSDGNKIGQLLVLTDITPIKMAEKRAREAENRLTDMTDSMPGMVFQYLWRGPDNGAFLYTSRGIEQILGITPPDIVGTSGGGNRLFGFTEESRLQFIRDIAEHAQRLDAVDLEVTVPREDGLHYLQVRGNFILQNDGSRILNGVIQDITTLKLQELELRAARHAAEEAMQIRSRFLATMSHELRTPISGIHGMLELLQMGNLSQEQKFIIRSITHSSNTLLYLVNDLLDFSKIEAGELQLHYQPSLLLPTICDVIRGQVTNATNKNITVNIQWDTRLPWQAIIDPMRIGQVISNLLNNAVKFTHQGTITVTTLHHPQDHLTITISDTGIGIPEDKHHRLFTPFEQIESDITRCYGGTGLGLAICEQLVSKMGGTIEMRSKPGKGSAFTFSVPLQNCQWQSSTLAGSEWWLLSRSPEKYSFLQDLGVILKPIDPHTGLKGLEGLMLVDEESLESLSGTDGGITLLKSLPLRGIIFSAREPLCLRIEETMWWRMGTSPVYPDLLLETCQQLLTVSVMNVNRKPDRNLHGRVLVADDHPINRELLARQLALFNLDVVLVNDGQQALQTWSEQTFNLLLTDLHMPVMDGYTLSRSLRSRNVKTPIIGITADISAKTSKQMLACGMSDILPKPYSIESLYNMLRHWLPDTTQAVMSVPLSSETNSEKQNISQSWIALFGDDTIARRMAEEYIRTSQEDCVALTKALKMSNTQEISDIAHRLKGTASIVSHSELEQKAADLELIAKSTSDETLRIKIQSILAEVNCYSQQTGTWIHG